MEKNSFQVEWESFHRIPTQNRDDPRIFSLYIVETQESHVYETRKEKKNDQRKLRIGEKKTIQDETSFYATHDIVYFRCLKMIHIRKRFARPVSWKSRALISLLCRPPRIRNVLLYGCKTSDPMRGLMFSKRPSKRRPTQTSASATSQSRKSSISNSRLCFSHKGREIPDTWITSHLNR